MVRFRISAVTYRTGILERINFYNISTIHCQAERGDENIENHQLGDMYVQNLRNNIKRMNISSSVLLNLVPRVSLLPAKSD